MQAAKAAKAPKPSKADKAEKHREIKIYIDPEGKVACDPPVLKTIHGHKVVFHCDAGDYEIDFNKNGTPFEMHVIKGIAGQSTKPEKIAKNPGPKPNPPQSFAYTVRVKGYEEHDPEVVIDPFP